MKDYIVGISTFVIVGLYSTFICMSLCQQNLINLLSYYHSYTVLLPTGDDAAFCYCGVLLFFIMSINSEFMYTCVVSTWDYGFLKTTVVKVRIQNRSNLLG